MAKRITCKLHDEHDRVIKVGVEGEVYPMLVIWNKINDKEDEFYTLENNKRAEVKARERDGTKYLTSHPDGFTPNNLDELQLCN